MSPFLLQGKTYHAIRNLSDFPAWYDGVHHAQNYDLLDGMAQFYSSESLFHDQIREHRWPLWNPYCGLGQPLYQGTGIYYYYPLTPLLHLTLPTHRVHDWMVFIHLLLAGLFMAWFLSLMQRGSPACHLGGVAWAFSGIMTTYLQFVPALINFAWFPAYLGCITMAARTRGKGWLAGAWLAGGLGVCSGFLNVAWICLAVGALWGLYVGRSLSPGRLGAAASLALVPILLSAAQTWPTLEMIALSYRVFIPPDLQIQRLATYVTQLPMELLVPDYWGNPAGGFHLNRIHPGQWFYFETCFYVGVIPVMLALVGAWKARGEAGFFRNLIVLQLLVVATPLWNLVSILPPVSKVNSLRSLFVLSFCLCVLAAAGLDYVMERVNLSPLAVASAGVALSLGLYLNFTVLSPSYLAQWLVGQEIRIPLHETAPTPEAWRQVVGSAAMEFYRWGNPSFYVPLLSLLALAGALAAPWSRSRLGAALVILTCLELLPFGARFNVPDSPTMLQQKPPTLDFLTRHNGPHRVLGLGTFRPNTLMPFKIHELTSYWSFLPRDSTLALSCLMEEKESSPRDILIQTFPMKNSSSPLLDLFGVRYLVPYPQGTVAKPGAQLRDNAQLPIYENLDAYPIAWMVPQAEILDPAALNVTEEIERLRARSYDFRRQARLFGPPATTAPAGAATVVVEEWSPGRLRATANEGGGWLIFSELYYPGWKVSVDGQEAPLYRADAVLMAVQVPAGSHRVEFRYLPQRVVMGEWVSLATLLGCLGLLAAGRRPGPA